ncbi:MAG: ABC transporter ATP-binding protein [Ruminococcaceae bacterium]|nr:ABC transporter ATP-binding protein [Oscillospiraceae bacterium]
MPPMGPPRGNDRFKVPPPRHLREVPGYLKKTVGGTVSRLLYIFRLLWECQPWLLLLRALMTVYEGFAPLLRTLITAHLLQRVVERITDPAADILPALLLQFGYLILHTVVTNLSGIVTRVSGEAVQNHIQVKILHKAKEVDVASFDKPDFYERLENANREAGHRPVSIMNETFGLVSRVISMVSFLVVLAAILPRLPASGSWFFAAFLLFNLISAGVAFHFTQKHANYMWRRSKDRRQMHYYRELMVNKDMVKEVRLFDLSDLFIGRYNQVFAGYFKGLKRLNWARGLWSTLLTAVTTVFNGALFYLIAVNVGQIADYSLYTGALNSLADGLTALVFSFASIYEGSLFIDNLLLFMKEKRTVTVPEKPASPVTGCGHTIELKGVSFRYPGAHKDVIRQMDLTIHAGETVALVGLNGAGKTTLIKLITRLYDPTEGVILLDGRDIKEYDLTALYRLYGIIFQDFGRYAQSAGDNIAFGNIHRPREEAAIRQAAAHAGADTFIEGWETGYDTPLTRLFEQDGKELSVGQWQKLSVARAFYGDADILILDEPTASLDAIAEQEIYRQFDRLRQGKTSIFVSHRLSSATTADRVVVLQEGQVVEQGTHRELMARQGPYHHLFSTQAERYRD